MEKIILKLKAVASILIYMSYAKDNVKDTENVYGLLAEEISDCVIALSQKVYDTVDKSEL